MWLSQIKLLSNDKKEYEQNRGEDFNWKLIERLNI